MIHILMTKGKSPVLNHFQSAVEANGYYRNGIDGEVVANKQDLAKLKGKHRDDGMVMTMLNRIDVDTLDGSKCSINDRGVCVVEMTAEAEKEDAKAGKAA